ncbi:MAG: hypothetical protein M4D80_39125 [Myxococcota bacterium]|nr:hypothetical protein [Myxococcota bacterium]
MKLVGERRALAAVIFAFYFLQYLMAVLTGQIPPEYANAFAAIAGVYGLAFFSLVAGYFWARWYSVGVGLYGVIIGCVAVYKEGTEQVYMFILLTHLAAAAMLWGSKMSVPYDGQTAWRLKFHMDDNAVQRLGRSVIRAGVSLPFVLLYALAPRPEASEMAFALTALALAGFGLRAVTQMKTWGILALGAAGSILVTQSGAQIVSSGMTTSLLAPALGGVLLLAAAAPFVPAMFSYLRTSATRSSHPGV